jgi:uncharacterized protein
MQARRSRSVVLRLFLSLALTLSALTSFAERVEDLPKPTNWVADFAHVLSPGTTERLDSLCGQLSHSKANAQIVTNRLEEKWKIGKKGSDRGIVMLFAIQDRKRRIEVGFGLEGILPDAKVGDIGRSMVPALRQGNYDGAVTTGVVQIANVIAADAGVTMQDQAQGQVPQPQREYGRREQRHASPIGLIFRIGLIILVLVFLGARGLFGFGLGMLFGGGGRWGGGGGGWGGGDGGGGVGGGFDGSGGGDSGGGGASGDW